MDSANALLSTILIWELARLETLAAGLEFIEPEQYLEGLTKGEELCQEEALEKLKNPGVNMEEVKRDLLLAPGLLADAGIDPEALRHALRGFSGRGPREYHAWDLPHRSKRSRAIFVRAEKLAAFRRDGLLRPGHLFLAILEEKDSPGCRILREMGADPETLAEKVREWLDAPPGERAGDEPEPVSPAPGASPAGEPEPSPSPVKSSRQDAPAVPEEEAEADAPGAPDIPGKDLSGKNAARKHGFKQGFTAPAPGAGPAAPPGAPRKGKPSEGAPRPAAGERPGGGESIGAGSKKPAAPPPPPKKKVSQNTPTLDRFGRDLTQEAAEGRLGPFIGRREEILQVLRVLARRTKNNPLLVGEAGVGKTAVVEAIAVRAAQGKNPEVLSGIRIIEINMGVLTAGTKYRGEFEERITRIMNEARENPDILLFIDEIHTVVGTGDNQGGLDAANLLKPALARGELRCIGATTIAEFRRHIESDPALTRRFEKILITEPSPEEALEILRGLRERYERHHEVRITDEALRAAVELSVRFDGERQLPDKAIDLVDTASARERIKVLSVNLALSPPPASDEAERSGGGAIDPSRVITDRMIAEALSERLHVPVDVLIGHLDGMDSSRLRTLEEGLRQRVIGQDPAVKTVCERLAVAYTGLTRRQGPLAVFLFAGPSGVGKTALARALAEHLFGSERDLIRFDMSEYMEEHSVAKLIGSPPGYVGYQDEGQLTGRLRTRPNSVVLLDEVEKAHPRVLDVFLQVFDAGRITDSKGRLADARHAIFILTMNAAPTRRRKVVGFLPEAGAEGGGAAAADEAEASVLEALKKRFRPEFLNRIDAQIVFAALELEDVKKIADLMIGEVSRALKEKYQKTLRVSEAALERLAKIGASPEYGVRHLRRAVAESIENPLSRLILDGELKDRQGALVDVEGEEIQLRPE